MLDNILNKMIFQPLLEDFQQQAPHYLLIWVWGAVGMGAPWVGDETAKGTFGFIGDPSFEMGVSWEIPSRGGSLRDQLGCILGKELDLHQV